MLALVSGKLVGGWVGERSTDAWIINQILKHPCFLQRFYLHLHALPKFELVTKTMEHSLFSSLLSLLHALTRLELATLFWQLFHSSFMRAYINNARKYAPLSQFRARGIKKTPPLSHFYIIMLKIDNPSRWTIFLIMRDAGEMLFSMSPRLTPPPDYMTAASFLI